MGAAAEGAYYSLLYSSLISGGITKPVSSSKARRNDPAYNTRRLQTDGLVRYYQVRCTKLAAIPGRNTSPGHKAKREVTLVIEAGNRVTDLSASHA